MNLSTGAFYETGAFPEILMDPLANFEKGPLESFAPFIVFPSGKAIGISARLFGAIAHDIPEITETALATSIITATPRLVYSSSDAISLFSLLDLIH
jgi:hypothetical protein